MADELCQRARQRSIAAGERAHDLEGEERVASALGEHPIGVDAGGGGAHELLRLLGTQRGELHLLEHLHVAEAAERPTDRVVVEELPVARREGDEKRTVPAHPRDVVQELGRGGVEPVNVVEHQDQEGKPRGPLREQVHHARRTGGPGRGERPRRGEAREGASSSPRPGRARPPTGSGAGARRSRARRAGRLPPRRRAPRGRPRRADPPRPRAPRGGATCRVPEGPSGAGPAPAARGRCRPVRVSAARARLDGPPGEGSAAEPGRAPPPRPGRGLHARSWPRRVPPATPARGPPKPRPRAPSASDRRLRTAARPRDAFPSPRAPG